MNSEMHKEIEHSVEKECIEWLHTELRESAGFDFDESEIQAVLQAYLEANNKNIVELTQKDKENIYGDILTQHLDFLTQHLDEETE
jgi:hypothetical protein